MTDMDKKLNSGDLKKVAGGTEFESYPPTRSNFCPRCRSAKHRVIGMEGQLEVRVCEVCRLKYYYRKW